MKRHRCTKCRRKRLEKFLRIVRTSDKPGSKVWICSIDCFDGRMSRTALAYMAQRKAKGSLGQSNLKNGLSQLQEGLSHGTMVKSKEPGNKLILDVCCGQRMFWFNKKNPIALFCDIKSDADPEIVQDFRNLEFRDNSFKLVVFDPPHLFDKKGHRAWLNKKYGSLHHEQWPKDITQGFNECMRVLQDYGILIFKWSEGDISVSTILSLLDVDPLFGHVSDKKSKTHWLCFMKIPKNKKP